MAPFPLTQAVWPLVCLAKRGRAISSEVAPGSHQENASNQEFGVPFRFDRNEAPAPATHPKEQARAASWKPNRPFRARSSSASRLPDVDDVAHAASLEELGRLVKTLGYEVVGTVSQKRDEIGGGTVLGKGRLEELAAITGGTGVVGSMATAAQVEGPRALRRRRRQEAGRRQAEPDPEAPPQAGVRDRRSRDLAEPGPQPRARHRRAGARPHRRHRRDLPSPRAQPRGEAAGRDRAAEVRRAAPAGILAAADGSRAPAPASPSSSSIAARSATASPS